MSVKYSPLNIWLCILLAVLLARCDREEAGGERETAVFTPTATVTSTPSPLLPPTTPTPPLSTPVPTIFPLITPAHPPENYQLTTWTENEAWELFQGFKNYRNAARASDQFWSPQLAALQRSMTDLGQEILLRSPDTSHQEDILWEMAWSEAAYRTDISIGYDPSRTTRYYTLINLIEAGLNNHALGIEHLGLALVQHRFQVLQARLIPNLFGYGQAGYVFLISPYVPARTYPEPGEDGILIVVQKLASQYKVIELDFTPRQFPDSFKDVSFEDLTGDGQPEIIVEKYFLMKGCSLFIQVWQWQSTAFVNIVDPFREATLSQSCDTPWGILPSENGQLPVVQTTEYNPFFAEDIIFQSQWNGEMLAARQMNYPPLIPSTNKYAIENIIEARYLSPNEKITALRQVLSEWSSLNLEVAGKSYPDFIRFQIGMIQMQSGDTHTSLKTLDSLTLSPTNPITPAISLAAQAYLTHYQKSGDIYHACREALNSMSQLLPFETLGSPFSEFSEKQFLQAWGYVPYSSYNASVCNLEVFLPMLLQSWNIDSLAELPDLLQQADVPIKASEYVDLDGDGINDWLMLIEIDEPTQTNNSYSFWAFLAEGGNRSDVV